MHILPYPSGISITTAITFEIDEAENDLLKRSLVQIVSEKFDCLPRAIIIAKCYADNNAKLAKCYLKNENKFEKQIKILCKQANVKVTVNDGHGIKELYMLIFKFS